VVRFGVALVVLNFWILRQFASVGEFCPSYLCLLYVCSRREPTNKYNYKYGESQMKACNDARMGLHFITVFIRVIYNRKQSAEAFPNRDASNRTSMKQAHFLPSPIYCLESVNDQHIQKHCHRQSKNVPNWKCLITII
jgi:hypothetical protein